MKKETEINGRPALETDQPLSVQEANVWGLEAREKADARKASIERLRCSAGKRRERKPVNPLATLLPDPTYRVKNFNPEADAFNVESSNGEKLLGKSLTNGNVRNGQKVRSFFAPNGQLLIDVKPKGRDIIIPKPDPKVLVEDPDIWCVTSCFLYTRIKNVKEKLTGNGAAQGPTETSWDAMRVWGSSASGSYAYGFAERLDDLGDYQTAADALNNKLKPDRLIVPTGGGSTGAGRDNNAVATGSQDAVTIWFYIGALNEFGTELVDGKTGKIFRVSGPSFYPSSENTEQGPGFCMEMYRSGSVSVGLYPIANIGQEPLTQYLSESFPDLGGKIGYWGNIYTWHGMQDYTTGGSRRTFLYREYWSGIAGVPAYRTEQPEVPTSTPPEWVEGVSTYSPWQLEDSNWYRFGWDYPSNRIGCMSAGAIGVNITALTGAGVGCGDTVPNDQWYWVHGVGSSAGALDKRAHYSKAEGLFVCWQGHVEHAGMAESFFQALGAYWEIPGATVTKLGSSNPYGCALPPENGGGYPPPPPSDASRFLVDAYGRKAKVILACHKQDYDPIEIELPFEYAAVVEEMTVLGGGSFGLGTNFEAGKTRKALRTYGEAVGIGDFDPFSLELVHGTLSIDAEFAYVNLFYGGERIHEEPMNAPVPIRLAAQGFGSPRTGDGANYGNDSQQGRRLGLGPHNYYGYFPAGYPIPPETTNERYARFLKDCWSRCLAIKVKLPTKEDKTLTIVATQKYKRGEQITLTAENPDNEFDNKFLVRDYRTDNLNLRLVPQNSELASFGGLPALMQQVFIGSEYPNSSIPAAGLFFKEKQDFTVMDWVHYQLQEMPRQYNPLITILPPGVTIEVNGGNKTNIIYDLDRKFGGHGRAEKIMTASSFGYSGTYYGGNSPTYVSQGGVGPEPLFISHKEQMIGNGLKKNGILTKWFRVTTGSFPIMGQLLRNNI